MDGRYLTFPELPPGYHFMLPENNSDIDIYFCETEKELTRERISSQLVAWVHSDTPLSARERSLVTRRHTYELTVSSYQEGIDVLVARAWMGMTGVKE